MYCRQYPHVPGNGYRYGKCHQECTIPDIPIYLIGTKLDLVAPTSLPLIEQRLYELKEALGIEKTFLISSKDGSGIKNTIHSIARDMWVFKNQFSKQKIDGKKEYSFYETIRSKK